MVLTDPGRVPFVIEGLSVSEPTTPATAIPVMLENVPVLPLRDVVVYPHMVIPLFVGREKSIQALDVAMRTDKRIMLVAQKQADVDDPKGDDLYRIATVATILQLLKLPDGTVKVLVEGVDRARIEKLHAGEYYSADATLLPDAESYDEKELDVLARSVISQFEQYVKLNKKVPPEVLTALAGIEQKIAKAGMPKEARDKAGGELNKLKMMSPMSAEATVVRNYIDWLLKVPWKKRTKIIKDIARAQKVLDEDHYGLDKVKERIVEYLAVQQRVDKLRGPILCLVGPPGVGKTSLGQSIARSTNRKFVRMSLGGVRDEAEIRGHRRTYIGSMPGKIVQNMSKAGVHNPLFLLDEVDKMSMDFRGDPSSALLEVLDPEQNSTFNDHYLEVDLDLSEVMFVCTANTLNIPPPLLDRMEVIRLPGYTEDEKLNIGRRYLVPKQMKGNGLKPEELKLSDTALLDIVRYYTREAGVRNLEREIAKICRKAVKQMLLHKKGQRSVAVTPRNLDKFLGVRRFRYGKAEDMNRVGQVTGLAWTEVGGELLTIEAAVVPGKGKLQHTGQLGEVMQESIQAAMTVVRSRAQGLGLEPEFYQKNDVHLHIPEGATPKDGPSAGIGMCTALVSTLTKIPVRSDVAMTGEITLRGEVLPIGGLKEKLLAAHRGGIKTVLIPDENVKDLVEIPDNIKGGLEIKPVKWIDEVLTYALTEQPMPYPQAPVATATVAAAAAAAADDKGSRRNGRRSKQVVPPAH